MKNNVPDSRIKIIYKTDRDGFIKEFNQYLDSNRDGYLLVLSPEDTFGKENQGQRYENMMAGFLADILDKNESAVLATPKRLFQFPDRITGVMFRVSMIDIRLDDSLIYNYEADFLIKLISRYPYLIQQRTKYRQGEAGDGNFIEFGGIYDKGWYLDNMTDHLLPLLKSYKGDIPYVVKMYAMYNITCRLDANQNNNNRHVLSEEEIDLFKDYIGEALQYIEDSIIMNAGRFPVYRRDFQFCRMLLRIKKEYAGESGDVLELKRVDSPEHLDEGMEDGDYFRMRNVTYPMLMLKGTDSDGRSFPAYTTSSLRCNIQFMDILNDALEIDGSVPDIFDKEKVSYYFELGSKKFPVDFCERYSLTKYFGRSAYKRYPFHVSIPLRNLYGTTGILRFCVSINGGESIKIAYEFKSHTSRLCYYPRNTYWHKGSYLMTVEREFRETGDFIVTGIKIDSYSWPKMAGKELAIGWELLKSLKRHRFNFFLLRAAWVVTHPFFSGKKIWLFFDKIYKGGDSSEYMYKYTCDMIDKASKDPSIKAPDKAYYLLDESAPDYKRMIAEGYKPLKRGSFLHRLVFLNADKVVVSNSTVFAFNDYYMENSRYIRGIPDFDVACVQHGLSVQKIALAQQRMRDNTKLYFIASKYEEENLLHPVYDYKGYDAIKLTGIPRYDGLKNDDKKQIIISPTWRMQSAKFVTRNEGVERDYNPDFVNTEYYKVYNSLINNKKLLSAAEQYGYRIKYILHPIVSPQAEDFDANDYVDIIPATGDMSYEKLFCESSLMVTDYSGIQFDFAYMRKPLVYYHPSSLEAHYEEGTFHYDTMAFGEIVRDMDELIELLISYMKDGCVMKELYRRRADDFFEFNDRENSKRVYDELISFRQH